MSHLRWSLSPGLTGPLPLPPALTSWPQSATKGSRTASTPWATGCSPRSCSPSIPTSLWTSSSPLPSPRSPRGRLRGSWRLDQDPQELGNWFSIKGQFTLLASPPRQPSFPPFHFQALIQSPELSGSLHVALSADHTPTRLMKTCGAGTVSIIL